VRLQVYLKSERAADALAAAEQSMDIMQVLQQHHLATHAPATMTLSTCCELHGRSHGFCH
jgi:hypothetical protein